MTAIPSYQNNVMAPQSPTVNDQPGHPFNTPSPQTKQRVWVNDGNLYAQRTLIEERNSDNAVKTLSDVLLLVTGNASDTVHISQLPNGQLRVQVNDQCYALDLPEGSPWVAPQLHIKTGAGNDRITIDPNVTVRVKIEAGDGDDTVHAGSGYTSVYGGRGNDDIHLGSGAGYAEGNEDDDTITGGSGHTVMYGNSGKDRLYAGAGPASKYSHLDGGADDDELYAGNGHTVLNGGQGNDLMVAHDHTAIYTGVGRDIVRANANKARIYAQPTDALLGTQNSIVTYVAPSEAGRQAFHIQGSPRFIQRVEDDLTLLRASPQGQKMLAALDKAAMENGAPINIRQSDDAGNLYDFWSTELQKMATSNQVPNQPDDPTFGFIKDGVAGSRADQGTIFYNPEHMRTGGSPLLPLQQFYHEMSHAWNGANGTFQPGISDPTQKNPEHPDGLPNFEPQAVGLLTTAPLYSFDGQSSTSTNPDPFNENTMNKEWGQPLRQSYD